MTRLPKPPHAPRTGRFQLWWVRDLVLRRRQFPPRSCIGSVLSIVLVIAVIITVDVLFFKDRFWERLAANVGIVLVFAAFYFRFLKRP